MLLRFQPALCCKCFSFHVRAITTKHGRNLNVYKTALRISLSSEAGKHEGIANTSFSIHDQGAATEGRPSAPSVLTRPLLRLTTTVVLLLFKLLSACSLRVVSAQLQLSLTAALPGGWGQRWTGSSKLTRRWQRGAYSPGRRAPA